jgi:dTDP-4-amino-4,6-dideoxygalactose transaminase
VFSLHPVKIISTGEGGLATTNDPVLAQRMAELRSRGLVREAERFEQPAAGPWVYEQQQLGFNYRITDIQAALGVSQLQRLDGIVAKRNRQLEYYRELLAGLPVQLLEVPEDVLSSVHLAVIRMQQATAEQHRQVFEGLRAAGIGVQLHYSPVHLQPYYRHMGFKEGQFPKAEAYATSAISLPLYPGLEVEDQGRVVNTLSTLLAA